MRVLNLFSSRQARAKQREKARRRSEWRKILFDLEQEVEEKAKPENLLKARRMLAKIRKLTNMKE